VQFRPCMVGILPLIYCMIKLDEYKLWEVVIEMEFQGNFEWNCNVCKDVRNPNCLVSWNSNNHSRSDRVEWIMLWGVAGGPRHWTWSSPRREGDLPWERSGEYSMRPDFAEFGNRCRCKPPRVQRRLHNPDIESRTYDWIACYEWYF